ncbi:MAG TPA: hypothetical protein VFH55_03780 [Nitrospiria bacterium]|nr:hypothetical protein [Nitrospiria bacterium]
MKGLRFEWIGNRHYSAVLHFGESFVPVEDNVLRLLSKQPEAPAEKFLEEVTERIGVNSYLKKTLRAAAAEGDPRSQMAAIKEFLLKHKQ